MWYTKILCAATLLCAAAGSGVVYAQTTGSIGIVAVVGDQPISSLDLQERMGVMIGLAGIADTPESHERLKSQVLHQLVDEALQTQDAAQSSITVSDAQLQEGIAQIERQNNKPPGSLLQFIDQKGLSKSSFLAQVRAQLAWSAIVLQKIRPKIRVSDQEIARYTKKINEAPHTQEVQIESIQLPVDSPASEANVKKLAEKLVGEFHSGVQFEAVAAQFSSGTDNTKATTPFWVDQAQLDQPVLQALAKAGKGGITDPVRTAAGYQIIRFMDVRDAVHASANADTVHTELAYKQILMNLKPNAQRKEAELLLHLASEVAKSPGKCNEKSMAGAGDLADLDFTVELTRSDSSQLPDKLHDLLTKLPVGGVSEPIITPQGIRLFMLCERVELTSPGTSASPAENEAARQAIYKEKLELEAEKYLRNLRREAFIDIRG